MRILLSGYHNPHYWTVTEYIERAIRALGHGLHAFDDGTRLIPGRLRSRSRWMERADRARLNRRLRACAGRLRPDVLIVLGGELIDPETVRQAKAVGACAVLWTIDAPWNFAPVLRAAPFYDHVFCQGTEAVEILSNAGMEGTRWLPMACDPRLHRPGEPSDEERRLLGHDIVFVGSWYPVRESLFEALAGLDLAIWGPGWDRLRSDSPLRGCVRAAHTTPETWRRIYAAAKIVLSVHFQDPLGEIPCHQASPRVFEAMACGAFVICDAQRDVLDLFEDGVHLAVAHDACELKEKTLYYLEHESERAEIARRAREEVLRRHTYRKRLETLFDVAGGASRAIAGRRVAGP